MCGRFTLASDPTAVQAAFPGIQAAEQLVLRYNVAPSQAVAVVRNDGLNRVELVRWGLIPFWAQDPAIGNRLINARAETLAEKPAFRTAFRRRRCLILADGFYEWRQESSSDSPRQAKTPFYFRLKSGQPFAFAGLWEEWRSPEGEVVPSCTIITTIPNALLEMVHNRMPVILQPEFHVQWLDPAEQDPARLSAVLQPYPAADMEGYAVSRLVNDPKNDLPDCLIPAED